MSSCRNALVVLGVAAASFAAAAQSAKDFPGIGRVATPAEIKAWDIDVRPDFKGLPPGSGSVSKGMEVWEAKCASCHGVFGESNSVFAPIVGGTTAEDMKTGRVARLKDRAFPQRTTLMKVSNVSTLWDYINRAMPWNAPKSLTVEEVYAVTAYILNLGEIVPQEFVLSDKTIAQVQAKLPNRNGMTTNHALWPGNEFGGSKRPDAANVACMNDCRTEAKVASLLPDFARDAHGNLAAQNRIVGPQRGADTTRPAPQSLAQAAQLAHTAAISAVTSASTGASDAGNAMALAQQHACTSCHGVDNKIVGPALKEIAAKYEGRSDGVAYLSAKIKNGGSGVWGSIPMPPQTLSDAEAQTIAQWLMKGAKQ